MTQVVRTSDSISILSCAVWKFSCEKSAKVQEARHTRLDSIHPRERSFGVTLCQQFMPHNTTQHNTTQEGELTVEEASKHVPQVEHGGEALQQTEQARRSRVVL
eukprot:8359174-Pyramimonas_sp.AAC.1